MKSGRFSNSLRERLRRRDFHAVCTLHCAQLVSKDFSDAVITLLAKRPFAGGDIAADMCAVSFTGSQIPFGNTFGAEVHSPGLLCLGLKPQKTFPVFRTFPGYFGKYRVILNN